MAEYENDEELEEELDSDDEEETENEADEGENQKKRLPKHLLYSIFNPTGGKGLTKEDIKKPRDLKSFFTFFFHNFNMMFALNIFAILGNFPILFGLYALTGNLNVNLTAPTSCLWPTLNGVSTVSGTTPLTMALRGVHGIGAAVSTPTTLTKTFGLLALLTVFTFGIVNTATAYVMRNTVKGEPTSFISDVIYSIKRNFKQAMLFGIVDFTLIGVMIYDLLIFFLGAQYSTLYSVFFGVMIVVALSYAIMRYYIYTMLVTFELSFFKLIKNAIIFTLLGIKRNVVALIGFALTVGLEYILAVTVMPVGIVLPMLILISFVNFMGIYAAYPVIKRYMIDPYYVSDEVGAKLRSEATEEDEEKIEPVFVDRG